MYDIRDMQLLQETLNRYEQLINRPYLDKLSCLPTISAPPYMMPIYLVQLTPFPSGPSSHHFSYILDALNGIEETIGYIINVTNNGICVFVGLKGNKASLDMAIKLLKAGLEQAFPNLNILPVSNSYATLSQLFNPHIHSAFCHSMSIPINSTPPIMNTFFDLMGNHSSYTVFFLASPFCKCKLHAFLDELYEIYHIFSMFCQSSHGTSKSTAKNTSHTYLQCSTQSDTSNANTTIGGNVSCSDSSHCNFTTCFPICCGNNKNMNISLLKNKGQSVSNAQTSSKAQGCSQCNTCSHTNSDLSSTNKTDTHSINFCMHNKCVEKNMEHLDLLINKIQAACQTPCFQFSSYFFSPHSETALRAAYNFSGLCQGSSETHNMRVNFWPETNLNFSFILKQLQNFDTPVFKENHKYFQPINLIKSTELVHCFYE